MRELLPYVLISVAVVGCGRRYEEPAIDAPHAIVRVRVVRHDWRGPQVDESVELNGYTIALPPAGPQATTRALRVSPERTRWEFATTFFHTEYRQVPRMVTDRYPCGTSNIGRASSTRYCTRSRMEMHTVAQRVVDASCRSQAVHTPIAGAAYLVQYDFFAHGHCTARCMRQIPLPNGEFRLVPCGPQEELTTSVVTAGGDTSDSRPSSQLGAP